MAPRSSVRSICQRMAALLNAYFPDDRITSAAINKWVERGSIPSSWLLRIPKVAEAEGRKVDIALYG